MRSKGFEKNECLIKEFEKMKNLKEFKTNELSLVESKKFTGGGWGTVQGSLLRGALYVGFAGAHAASDFVSGFVDRFTKNAK